MDTIADIIKDPMGENLRGEKETFCDIASEAMLKGTIVLAKQDGLVKCPAGVIPSGVVRQQEDLLNGSYATSYIKSFAVMVINGDGVDIPEGSLVYSKGDGTITATETGQAFATCKGNDVVAGTTQKVCKVEVL